MKTILFIGILTILMGCHPQIRECRSAKMKLARALENYLDSCGCRDSSKYRSFHRSVIHSEIYPAAVDSINWSEFFKTKLKEIPGPGNRQKQW